MHRCILLAAVLLFSCLLQSFGAASLESSAAAASSETSASKTTAPALTIEPHAFEPHRYKGWDGKPVAAELGRFRVPENREKAGGRNREVAGGRTLELHFVRFKSTAAKPGPPIVYLAGGPGGSGTATATGSRFPLFMSLRSVADVIAFDQRGTGMNESLPACSRGWELPWDQAGTRAAFEAAAREGAEFCAAEWRAAGVDLDAYNTEESADDLEALRKALGVPKISLWSISYGSHLAMSTLRRHPDSLASVILAGPEGPDHTFKLPEDGQEILDELRRRIATDPEAKTAFPTLFEDMKAVFSALEKKPRSIAVPDGEEGSKTLLVGAFDTRLLGAGMLGAPQWQRYLPGAFRSMAEGDFSQVASFLAQGRDGDFYAMSAAMDAASGISPARRKRIAAEAKETLLQDAINFPLQQMMDALKVPDLGSAFRGPLETDVPVLVISGTLDGRTSVNNATELLPGFRRGHHLILDGAGHSDPLFLSSPRIEDIMKAFLQGKAIAKETRITVDFPQWGGLEETAAEE